MSTVFAVTVTEASETYGYFRPIDEASEAWRGLGGNVEFEPRSA